MGHSKTLKSSEKSSLEANIDLVSAAILGLEIIGMSIRKEDNIERFNQIRRIVRKTFEEEVKV